jgi:hypothetical protein
MDKLVRMVQAELDPAEAASVPALIEQVSSETMFTQPATGAISVDSIQAYQACGRSRHQTHRRGRYRIGEEDAWPLT